MITPRLATIIGDAIRDADRSDVPSAISVEGVLVAARDAARQYGNILTFEDAITIARRVESAG